MISVFDNGQFMATKAILQGYLDKYKRKMIHPEIIYCEYDVYNVKPNEYKLVGDYCVTFVEKKEDDKYKFEQLAKTVAVKITPLDNITQIIIYREY